jgi:glycerate kinase
MNILVALDSISDFENSIEIANFFKEELTEYKVKCLPFLDGGKGTVDVMKTVIDGKYQYVNVHNPLNEVITARYVTKNKLAVMEMAESSGLRLLYKEELEVMNSSSLGFGEMLRDGLDQGCNKFFVGIGDTATHDMGMGMLYALGVRFFDKDGNQLNPVAKNMIKVFDVDFTELDKRIKNVSILLATSLNMSLFGKNSFLETRPIRKGASLDDIKALTKGSRHFSKVLTEKLGMSEVDFPSLGSGGGVARALYIMFGAKVQNSMDLVLELVDFEKLIEDIDLLILGENVEEFDAQSSINISQLAKRYNPNIKIIFLQDIHSPRIKDNEFMDSIVLYEIDEKVDRKDYPEEIKRIARNLFQDEKVKKLLDLERKDRT